MGRQIGPWLSESPAATLETRIRPLERRLQELEQRIRKLESAVEAAGHARLAGAILSGTGQQEDRPHAG